MENYERAYAKLNLTLDVLGQRGDGYHEMRMIMLSVSLYDEIGIRLIPGGRISARSNLRYLPDDERNISCRAAKLFFERAGMEDMGAEILHRKRIPVCAGLAGGSTDGAAVLRSLNRVCGRRFSPSELEEMARGLGSDVAFCVRGGTQEATGRGDELSPLPDMPRCFVVIAKPSFSIKTPELFAKIDSRRSPAHPDTDGTVAALHAGDLGGVARRMYNVFEDVLPQKYSGIADLKRRLYDLGALGACMTGTGSAVFGIFETKEQALLAREALRKSCAAVFYAAPTGRVL